MRVSIEVVGPLKEFVNLLRVCFFYLLRSLLIAGTFLLDIFGILDEKTVDSPIFENLFTGILGSLVTSKLDVLLDLIQFGNCFDWLPQFTILIIYSPDFLEYSDLRDRSLRQLIFSQISSGYEFLFISLHISHKMTCYLAAFVSIKLFIAFCHAIRFFFGRAASIPLNKCKIRLGISLIK